MIDCEPLINKYTWNADNKWQNKNKAELDKSNSIFYFNRVVSAVRFYERYYWNNYVFKEDYPSLYQEFIDTQPEKQNDKAWLYAYQTWLLGYSFRDVIEK